MASAATVTRILGNDVGLSRHSSHIHTCSTVRADEISDRLVSRTMANPRLALKKPALELHIHAGEDGSKTRFNVLTRNNLVRSHI